jgi:hypothetical protein
MGFAMCNFCQELPSHYGNPVFLSATLERARKAHRLHFYTDAPRRWLRGDYASQCDTMRARCFAFWLKPSNENYRAARRAIDSVCLLARDNRAAHDAAHAKRFVRGKGKSEPRHGFTPRIVPPDCETVYGQRHHNPDRVYSVVQTAQRARQYHMTKAARIAAKAAKSDSPMAHAMNRATAANHRHHAGLIGAELREYLSCYR